MNSTNTSQPAQPTNASASQAKPATSLNANQVLEELTIPDGFSDQLSSDGNFDFKMNRTIKTNDNSAVGDFMADQPAEEQIIVPTGSGNQLSSMTPEKMDFIKTYTQQYDDLVAETTHAVHLTLESIDRTVREHLNYIAVPEEMLPFIEDKPADGKVDKFDDAQRLIRLVMAKAAEAKQQAEQAAHESAQIYDDIQQFKKDTNERIEDINNRDEFGQPRQTDITNSNQS